MILVINIFSYNLCFMIISDVFLITDDLINFKLIFLKNLLRVYHFSLKFFNYLIYYVT